MKGGRRTNSLENSENLTNLLVSLSGKWDTPALIAYLADERVRLLLCKAMVSPVSDSDRQLAQRARKILRSRGMDPDELKAKLEPAAFALGLIGACDFQIDYYDVLGINHSATSSEVRSAYRKKAFEIHPDTAGSDVENSADFVTLKAAYDTLLDPKSRVAFDQCQEQFDSWHEEETEDRPDKKVKRPPSGKLRKACYRVGAVVMALVVMAWVINLFYERASMMELVEITPSTVPGPALETTGSSDLGKVARKTAVVSQEGEDKTSPKLAFATKKPEPEKPEPEKAELVKAVTAKREPEKAVPQKQASQKPAREKPQMVHLKTAVPAVPEPVAAEKPVKERAKLTGDRHQEKRVSKSTEEKKQEISREVREKGIAVLAAAEEVLKLPEGPEKEEIPTPEVKQVAFPPPVKKEKAKAAPMLEPVPAKALPIVATEKKQAPKERAKLTGDRHQEKRVSKSTEKKKQEISREVREKGIAVLAAAAKVLKPPEGPEKEEIPTPEVKQVASPPPVKKEKAKAAPVLEPVLAKALPIVATEKKQASVVGDSLKKIPEERPKPIKKERAKEIPEAVKKKQPRITAWVQQAAIKPKASGTKPGVTSSPAEKVQKVMSEIHVSKVSVPTFPVIPLPKTHETPFIKRSQVLAFLKKYTVAYEKGNAETFFSFFTVNATENGKPLKMIQPDYLEIWEKVRSLDYHISLDETEQEVGSDTVLMKGRFDLGWVFLEGQSGQSHGEIAMDLKVNKDAFLISRLDYQFDE